jgi:hypothetical protein
MELKGGTAAPGGPLTQFLDRSVRAFQLRNCTNSRND